MKDTMIRTALFSFALVVASCGLLLGHAAAAQTQPPIVVGVVDFDHIIFQSKAGKGVKAAVKKLDDAFKADFAKQEKNFRDKEAKINAERDTLSDAEFKEKLTELQSEMQEANQKFRSKQKQIEDNRDNALRQINKILVEIVREIANERGMTLILSKFNIVFAAEDYDITSEALKRLDAKLPSVKL